MYLFLNTNSAPYCGPRLTLRVIIYTKSRKLSEDSSNKSIPTDICDKIFISFPSIYVYVKIHPPPPNRDLILRLGIIIWTNWSTLPKDVSIQIAAFRARVHDLIKIWSLICCNNFDVVTLYVTTSKLLERIKDLFKTAWIYTVW